MFLDEVKQSLTDLEITTAHLASALGDLIGFPCAEALSGRARQTELWCKRYSSGLSEHFVKEAQGFLTGRTSTFLQKATPWPTVVKASLHAHGS